MIMAIVCVLMALGFGIYAFRVRRQPQGMVFKLYAIVLSFAVFFTILSSFLPEKEEYIEIEGVVTSKDVIRHPILPIKYQITVSVIVPNTKDEKDAYMFFAGEKEYVLLQKGDKIPLLYNAQKNFIVQKLHFDKYRLNKESFEKYIEEKYKE